MGDEQDQTQRLLEPASGPAAPTADIAAPVADPFASTLTVAVGPAPSGPRLEPGRELGPVRLVREIGRGATGAVFHGHHTVLGRDVAVKFLINVTAGPGDAEGVRRFVDEARAAASVRHTNLTQIFHADLDGSTPYLVLEFVPGPTLRQLLDHAGELSVPVMVAVIGDVASAVAELHARGIIHRDIKPSNVLVDKDGRVFVTDFGLALRRSHAVASGASAAETGFAGTPAYMAGEMFDGRVSARSDVYAMGIVAFQLLTGSTPFSGTFHELRDKQMREPLPSDALRSRGVKPEVVEVLERATHKQPMFRYKTAPDFARALRDASGCSTADLARARKQLCDLVAARVAGAPPPPGAGHPTTAEVRVGRGSGGSDDDSGTSLYVETISRIATVKRERRRHPGTEADGSSTGAAVDRPSTVHIGVPPAVATETGAAGEAPLAGSLDSPPSPAPAPVTRRGAAQPSALPPQAEPTVPGPVLSVSVLAVMYGTLAALWQVGVLCGARNLCPDLPPASAATAPLFLWLVPAGLVHATLAAAMVVAAVSALGLRRWGRRGLVVVSAADVVLQAMVLIVALAWVAPATVRHQLRAIAAPAARATVEASTATQWLVLWFALSLFPAAAVGVLARRRVREAYDAAASSAEAAAEALDDAGDSYF
jgi:serine/threonine protein kinase